MQIRLPNGQLVYQEDYSCIVEPVNGKAGIYIGNLEAAQNLKTLKKHGIRAILTAAKGIDLNHPKSEIPFYLQVPGEDRDGFDMTRFFEQGVKFIRDALETTSIMVHCLAGVSRSVCLVLAYFIKCKGMTYDEAYSLTKMKRNIIHPNEGFIAQLRKYEAQVRASNVNQTSFEISSVSPTRYQGSLSPTKRRYQYYYEQQLKQQLNPEAYKPDLYISPSKRVTIESSYTQIYESPTKKNYQQLINQSYESPSKGIYQSPSKARQIENRYQPSYGLQLRKIGSYNESVFQPEDHMRHISPDRRRPQLLQQDPRGRSNSIIEPRHAEPKIPVSNYDRFKHASSVQLSEQLDSKIAAIRQKYSQYTKNTIGQVRRASGRDSQPRINNFLDENEVGSQNLSMKKMASQFEAVPGRYNPRQFGIVRNSDLSSGLGLKRLNSLRDGAY